MNDYNTTDSALIMSDPQKVENILISNFIKRRYGFKKASQSFFEDFSLNKTAKNTADVDLASISDAKILYNQIHPFFEKYKYKERINIKCEELFNELYKSCSFEDWDGYGASPIKKEIIERTKSFINLLSSNIVNKIDIDEICPNPNGTITIEFGSKNRYLQIEIGLTKINIVGKVDYDSEFFWENFKINNNNLNFLNQLIIRVL
ncbi:MAG: hypothetical protein KAW87_00590 [Candidatus Cloacimonetes bacterium]|nr:hypothetical protein [Candidatus Cloacimonadota bacterium]